LLETVVQKRTDIVMAKTQKHKTITCSHHKIAG